MPPCDNRSEYEPHLRLRCLSDMSRNRAKTRPSRIDEELVCVDSLQHVLRTRCNCNHVEISREQDDPPDFTVTIDGDRFPTEVTSVVWGLQYRDRYMRFAHAIREGANSLGILSGKYAFSVLAAPEIPKPTSPDGRRLVAEAIMYIDRTKAHARCAELQLQGGRSGRITIGKLSPNGLAVELCRAPAMWEGEVLHELALRIQHSIDDKTRKLSKAGFGPGEVFLLLYDAFNLAEVKDVAAALRRVSGFDWFHSVFWAASFADRMNEIYPAEPGRNGLFLFSRESTWESVGTIL